MIINRDRESRDTRFLSVIECAMTAQNFQGAIDWQRIDCVTAPGRRGGAKERVVDCFFGRLDHRKRRAQGTRAPRSTTSRAAVRIRSSGAVENAIA